MAKYKVGDKVRIKRVKECNTFQCWNLNGEMDHWCGQIMTIRAINPVGDYKMEEDFNENNNRGWFWKEEWLEPITYFIKDDLKTGMTVTTRDGEIFVVYGEHLLVLDGVEPIGNYRTDLTHCNLSYFDIVEVHDFNKNVTSLKDILCDLGKLIWKRKKEREISSEEAFKILKEHYGCDVKIKE